MTGILMAAGGGGKLITLADVDGSFLNTVEAGGPPIDSAITIGMTNTGRIYRVSRQDGIDGPTIYWDDWLLVGSAGDYDATATYTGSLPASGSFGSPVNLGTTREWVWDLTSLGTKNAVLTLSVGRTGGSALDTADITLELVGEI